MTNQKTISWEAPEFKHYEKNAGWYTTLIAVSILIMGFLVIVQKDIFGAVTIAIITAIIIFFSRHEPGRVTIELTAKHIQVGNIQFPYKQLKAFWVVNNENHKTLNLHTTAYLNHTVILELNNQDPNEVHEFLSEFLPEHPETGETVIQKIIHKLKF